MHGQTNEFRFEYASLALVVSSVVALYGIVLSERFAPRTVPEATIAARAPIVAIPAPEVLGPVDESARWLTESAESVGTLVELFGRADYRLDGVRVGDSRVPRILIDRMPADLHRVVSADTRKSVFIRLMLPMVLYANERIRNARARVTVLRARFEMRGGRLAADERAWLLVLGEHYGVEGVDFKELLRHVDEIPPSLAIAQAAEESGWGTSRFVREGNAVFGQRTFTEGKGLVPLRRDEGETHEVKTFNKPLDSVIGYMINLNSHFAYDEFRLVRERQRRTMGRLDGYALSGTLNRYSERGEAYIATIRSIIAGNELHQFDGVSLGNGEALLRLGSDV